MIGLPLALFALIATSFPSFGVFGLPSIPSSDEPELIGVEKFPCRGPPKGPGPKLPTPKPLVLWHGLGDSHLSPGMAEFINLIKEMHEDIFVHSVYISQEPSQDQRAGWFGNVDEQLEQVAEQILDIEELQGGFDAIGFSQGGQFLRGYVERYNSPPVHNLITFGSQHLGVASIPGCKPTDFVCKAAHLAVRSNVYTGWAQSNIVPAQYYRDHTRYDIYLKKSGFLADINNEIPLESDDDDEPPRKRNETYAKNFASLNALVLAIFDQDKTVVPKESSWFGGFNITDGNGEGEVAIVDMKDQPLYKEDWIGLRKLDEAGRVVFKTCVGEHMQMNDECWRPIVQEYVGSREIPSLSPESSDGCSFDHSYEDIHSDTLSIPNLLIQDW